MVWTGKLMIPVDVYQRNHQGGRGKQMEIQTGVNIIDIRKHVLSEMPYSLVTTALRG